MKRFLFFATLIMGAFHASAQSISTDLVERDAIEYRNSRLAGGITPFVTLGSYEFGVEKNDSRLKPTQRFGVGAHVGLYARHQFTIETGLEYLPVGTRLETSAPGYNITSVVDLDYLAAPIVAKKYFRDDLTGFYAKAALIPAYLFNADAEVRVEGTGLVPVSAAQSVDVEDSYKKFDIQGALGVGGVFIANDVNRIFLDLTWGRSLAPISKSENIDVYNEGFLFSSGFTL